MLRFLLALALGASGLLAAARAADGAPVAYRMEPTPEGSLRVIRTGAAPWDFAPAFTVLVATEIPGLAMRPGGVPRVPYNVPTWQRRALRVRRPCPAASGRPRRPGMGLMTGFWTERNTASRTVDVLPPHRE